VADTRIDLPQGTLDLLILKTLSLGDRPAMLRDLRAHSTGHA